MNEYTSIADLYDLYVTDVRDHPFWSRRAAQATGPILELTAGTGRATVALRAGGRQPIVALDRSRAMLDRLVARLRDPRIAAVAGDLVSLPFAGARFGLVVIPFNSLGELVEASQREAALSEVSRVLAPAGRAVVTLHNPSLRRRTLDNEERTLGPFWSGNRRLEVSVRGRLLDREVAVSEQTYRVMEQESLVEERRIAIRFALPDLSSLSAAADAAGLAVVDLFGDYDESAFQPERSPFILAVLARPSARAA